jgi:hypothetical protein
MRAFTIREKKNGEWMASKLTGFAKRYTESTDPLNIYEVDGEGLYYTDGSNYMADAHGPFTLDKLQEELLSLYTSGCEYLFYIRTNAYDIVVYASDGVVKYHTQDEGFPVNPSKDEALEFLEELDVANVNPWEEAATIDELINGAEVLAEYFIGCL